MEKTKTIHIGVEVFGTLGGDPVNDNSAFEGVALNVPPGRTVTFETQGGGIAATNADGSIPLGNLIAQGSARIVSTSAKIICSALLMSATGTPPTSMASLQVIKKKSQKGD